MVKGRGTNDIEIRIVSARETRALLDGQLFEHLELD